MKQGYFENHRDHIAKSALKYVANNDVVPFLPPQIQSQLITAFFNITQDPSIPQDLQQKALKLINSQLSSRFSSKYFQSQEWISRLIILVTESDSIERKRASQKIIQILVSRNIDLLDQPDSHFIQLLQTASSATKVFNVFLAVVKGCNQIQVSAQRRQKLANFMHQIVLPNLVNLYRKDESLENLYLFTKICKKLYHLRIFTIDKYGVSTIILSIISQAAFYQSSEYDIKQLESCPNKNSSLFFYFHAKKWAFRIILRLVTVYKNPMIFHFQNNKQSYYESSIATWVRPYMYQFIYQLPNKTTKQTFKRKLQLLEGLVYNYLEQLEPYIEILMKQMLPSFMYLSLSQEEQQKKNKTSLLLQINTNVERVKSVWQLIYRRKQNSMLNDELIDLTEEMLLSPDQQKIYIGLQLFGCILQRQQNLHPRNYCKIRGIINGIFTHLLSSEKRIIQGKAFLTLYTHERLKDDKSKVHVSSVEILKKCYEGVIKNDGYLQQVALHALLSLSQSWTTGKDMFDVDSITLIQICCQLYKDNQYNRLGVVNQFIQQICSTDSSKSYYLMILINLYKLKSIPDFIMFMNETLTSKQQVTQQQEEMLTDILYVYMFSDQKGQNKGHEKSTHLKIQITLFDKLLSISKYFELYLQRITKFWSFKPLRRGPRPTGQIDLMQFRDYDKIENLNYSFLIKYIKKAAKVFTSITKLKESLFEPIFQMVGKLYFKVNLPEVKWDWFITLNLLRILFEQYRANPILQEYFPQMERIIHLNLSSRFNEKKRQSKGYLERAITQLIITYLSINRQLAPSRQTFVKMAQHLIGNVIQTKEELPSFQIIGILSILSRLLKAQIYTIKLSDRNTVGTLRLALNMLLQLQSNNISKAQSLTQEHIKAKNHVYKLNEILDQHHRQRQQAMKQIDLEETQELTEMRSQIARIKENQNEKLKITLIKFTEGDIESVQTILKFQLR